MAFGVVLFGVFFLFPCKRFQNANVEKRTVQGKGKGSF